MSNYHKIYNCDLSNGEGVRIALFLSGCIHACEGCYNESTWSPKSGKLLTDELISKLIDDCHNHDGLSISGGDPFHIRNRDTVFNICSMFKLRYPGKDIWLWTGYSYEDIIQDETIQKTLKLIDVMIDGKYEKDNPTQKPWRGSDNQRLIRLLGGIPIKFE